MRRTVDADLVRQDAVRAERQRIWRELHNSTSQLLVALQLQLSQLRRSGFTDAEPLIDEMDQVLCEIHECIKAVRSSRSEDDKRLMDPSPRLMKIFHSIGLRDLSDS